MTATPDKPAHGKPKCGGRTTAGGQCGRPAGWGTDHVGVGRCKLHLGNTPNHRKAGARMLAESKARQALDEVGVREVDNPLAELRALTGEVVAWKDALARHVAALEDSYRYRDDKGGEQLRAEVALYERALDRAGKLLETWARLGIDSMLADMHVRVTAMQVDALSAGLEAYRDAAGVDGAAHARGLEALAGALRGGAA